MNLQAPTPNEIRDHPFAVPALPSRIRYCDDFSDTTKTIESPATLDLWTIEFDGKRSTLNFLKFSVGWRPLVKHWTANELNKHSPATATYYFQHLHRIEPPILEQLFTAQPQNCRERWNVLFGNLHCHGGHLEAARSVLRSLCDWGLNGWSKEWSAILSTLPGKSRDKYAAVRTGDAFLSAVEEASVIAHIDQITVQISSDSAPLSNGALADACLLTCAYQFGFRPKQLALLNQMDVQIWPGTPDEQPTVHLTFRQIKQRRGRDFAMVRRVKREWAPLFVELFDRNRSVDLAPNAAFFGVSSPDEVSRRMAVTTEDILEQRRTPTEFRHTAAQRLVDAGASHEELAEFLGHADNDTGLIYFRNSASQAERVNQALGISPIYQEVVRIAHAGFISPEELERLQGDQQIAAIPHGIPIAGIGGCGVGQPACPSNPVLGCYGCRKFMPLRDVAVHESVLSAMRTVVTKFVGSSRDDVNSPAYLQLRRSIASVEAIIGEVRGSLP